MSDIFISYAREDKAIAEALVNTLLSTGFSVWWDHQLTAGSHFRQAILSELISAQGVIVIWSDHSVESEFVLDEADEARRRNTLISTAVDGFDIDKLPLGFRNRHTIELSSIDHLRVALEQVGLSNSDAKLVSPFGAESSHDAQDERDHDQTSPSGPIVRSDDPYRYVPYHSDVLGVWFSYPDKILVLDTTRHTEGIFELISESGETEIKIFPSPLAETRDVRRCQENEATDMVSKGWRITYKAPQLEKNWSNWYVISGLKPDKNWFYYRRWMLDSNVVSIEFEFPGNRKSLYTDLVSAMTLDYFVFD